MNKVLPIGAVVLLKEAQKPLMIVGYKPTGIDKEEKDYMGVLYPIGYTSLNEIAGFNHKDIEEILYEGYINNNLFQHFIKKTDIKLNDEETK